VPVSARLAPVSVRWDENDLLDNRGDMVNGVNTETMQTVAQKLATDIVDKMQEVSELKKDCGSPEAKGDALTSHTVVAMKQSGQGDRGQGDRRRQALGRGGGKAGGE
jgi:hypothetical protein